jgi:hypothetical protein
MKMVGVCFAELPHQIAVPEDIENPKDMAVALTFARSTAKKYIAGIQKVIDRIEDAAMAMSDQNIEIPYHVRVIESGRKTVTDLGQAFLLSGLTNTEFYAALTCSLPKLAGAYAKKTGMKTFTARKEIEGKLNSVIVVGEAKTVLERVNEEVTFAKAS